MTLERRARARLVEYLPFMLRDYAANQGLSTLVVLCLIGFLFTFPPFLAGGFEMRQVPAEIARQLLQQLAPTLAFLGALFATNGIVSGDRRAGYFRFLFAKPLNPVAYYAQAFGAAFVGMMVVTVILLGVFAATVRPMFPLQIFFVVTVMFLTYGGIGFLLSSLWRLDWLSLVTVVLVATVGWSVWGTATGWKFWILHVLPPVHRTDALYGLISAPGMAVPWASVAWLAGYGATCFALGLVAVRFRQLGSG